METVGLWMFGAVAGLLLVTGLPAWVVLLAVALAAAVGGLLTGALTLPILTALPPRLIGLLEQDLLQALPMYVLMGALLHRLPLARILFRTGTDVLPGTRSAPQLTSLVLGVLLAPINGSVGASVTMLSRTVQQRLQEAGVSAPRSAALICIASTFGVVIPPSLVLILLGDAMMRAHTEAANMTHQAVRIVNTQDVFRGALLPAGLLFFLCALAAWWSARRMPAQVRPDRPKRSDWIVPAGTFAFLIALLAGVALGFFYAVEGAAAGGLALIAFGMASRTLTRPVLREVLRDTMALSGALFALLIAATMFTLVLRIYGTDRWIAGALTELNGSSTVVLAIALLVLGLCALVFDAFEIIFVVIPLVMPPLLVRVPDAVWVAVIALLILQASFLIPPLGYAVLLIRGEMNSPVPLRQLVRALAPYVLMQGIVLVLVLGFPGLTHLFDSERDAPTAASTSGREDDPWLLLQQQRDQQDAQ